MKVAVCFSGLPTRLEECYKNIKEFLDYSFEDYDVYGYFPDVGNSKEIDHSFHFEQKEFVFEKDVHIETKDFWIHCPTQPYLQQIFGYKKCFEMVENSKKEYDFIVRCRPDVLFFEPYHKIEQLKENIIYIPNFHHWGGFNDRFAIGSPNVMKYYMRVFDFVMSNQQKFYNAEGILATCLALHNVQVKLIPLYFRRVRKDVYVNEHIVPGKLEFANFSRYPQNLITV